MEPSSKNNDHVAQSRHPQPLDPRRSVAEGGGQHDPRAEEHHQQDSTAACESETPAPHDVGSGLAGNDPAPAGPRRDTPDSRDVAELGERSSGNATSVDKPKRRRSPRLNTDVTRVAVLQLLEDQQYQCALTKRSLEPQNACIDHIVALSCGGEHRLSNIQVLDREVNRAKGTLGNDEFVAMCGEVWLTSTGPSPNDTNPNTQPTNGAKL